MRDLKLELLKLLEEDREFRLMVAGFLGYREVLERLEKHDRKFEEILKRLEAHDRKFNEILENLKEHAKILEEHDRKFNEILERLDGHARILGEHTALLEEFGKRLAGVERRLEEHDRKFNEILGEIRKLREDFAKLSLRVEATIGSMGRRWGADLERAVLEIFRELLEERGIEPGKVEKFRYRDEDGSVTGVRGRIIDVDVLVSDDKVYVIEVKSRAELDHVEALPEKAKVVEKVLKKKVEKVYLVAVNVDREAYERAGELGIEVIYGHIVA